MTAKELISQYVDTGLQLPEYQVNKLSNQDKKTYIRKRLIAAQYSQHLDWYEMELLNPDERDTYISNLTSEGIGNSLSSSTDRDKSAEMIINSKGDTLDYDDIHTLLYVSNDNVKIAEIINKVFGYDKVKEFLSGLAYDDINDLLVYSKDKDKIAGVIINSKGDKLDSDYIQKLLYYSKDKDKIAEMIINAMGDTLDSDGIEYLLYYSKNPEAIKRIFDKYGIDYPMYESIKSLLRKNMIYL